MKNKSIKDLILYIDNKYNTHFESTISINPKNPDKYYITNKPQFIVEMYKLYLNAQKMFTNIEKAVKEDKKLETFIKKTKKQCNKIIKIIEEMEETYSISIIARHNKQR